jgi:Flp pilus assembly protein TadG
MFSRLRQLLRLGRDEGGAVAVEFGIILPVLLTLVVGGMDLGHSYYIKHIITNASREGARYAAKYTFPPSSVTSTAISNYVKLSAGLNYDSFKLDTLVVTLTPSPAVPGSIATVKVQAKKHWWILGTLPGFTNPQQLTATTAMRVEGP